MRDILIAKLFGYLLGDGWLSLSKKKICNCGFSGDYEGLVEIKEDLKTVFVDKAGIMTIRQRQTSSPKYNIQGQTNELSTGKTAFELFNNLGHPIGRKVEQDFILSDWIINGSNEIKCAFLSGLMGAEGYRPSMQKNNITPKVLGLTLTKRDKNKELFIVLAKQLQQLFSDLDIDTSLKFTKTKTVDDNIKLNLIIKNSTDNIIKFLSLVGYSYCPRKTKLGNKLLLYLENKQKTIEDLFQTRKAILKETGTAKQLAIQYNVSINQIENWRRGRGVRIQNSFPKIVL